MLPSTCEINITYLLTYLLTCLSKNGRRITSSMKHRIEAYDEGGHTLMLSLRIHITDNADFGEYRCIASNSLGQDDGSMVLYGKIVLKVKFNVKGCLLPFMGNPSQSCHMGSSATRHR